MFEHRDSLRETLIQEGRAASALYSGDAEPYKALWSHGDDVSLFGAFGPCKSGWVELSRIFDWIATRFCGGTVSLDYQVVIEGNDLAYTVALEHGRVPVDGGDSREHTIRVTQIYRREEGRWRLVHRHGDFAPVDESPAAPKAAQGIPQEASGPGRADYDQAGNLL